MLLRLAEKAFRPGRFPFPLLNIDTGHNYEEVIDFRDFRACQLNERLIVRSVEDSMRRGTVVLKSPRESRNKHQSVTLLEASVAIHRTRRTCLAVDLLRAQTPSGKEERPAAAGNRTDPGARRRCCGRVVGALSYRGRHHLHRTGRVEADTVAGIIEETATTTITERGETRLDDQTLEASMEQRKKEGYF